MNEQTLDVKVRELDCLTTAYKLINELYETMLDHNVSIAYTKGYNDIVEEDLIATLTTLEYIIQNDGVVTLQTGDIN